MIEPAEVQLTCVECRAALTSATAWASDDFLTMCRRCAMSETPSVCRECRGWGCKRRCFRPGAIDAAICPSCGGEG